MTVFRSNSGAVVAGSGGSGVSQNNSLPGAGDVLKVMNTSTLDAYIKTGVGAQTATTSDIVVVAKSEAFLQIDFADDNIAVKTPNSSTNILVMRGSVR